MVAAPRTLFSFGADVALCQFVYRIDDYEFFSASALVTDVGDECAWFGVVEFIGEGVVAAFADAHVAEVVVVDSVVADGGADSADVADEVEVGDVLVVVGVSEGAALFGAGGEAAVDAVEAGADAAD